MLVLRLVHKVTDMDGTTDGAQKSSEALSRIRIEQVAGSLENPSEGTYMCTLKL